MARTRRLGRNGRDVSRRFAAWTARSLVLSFLGACGGGGGSSPPPNPPPNPTPAITSLAPASVVAGAAAQPLAINGSEFMSASTVTLNGTSRNTNFVSASQLTIALTAADQAIAGAYPVVVSNPPPGGGPSSSLNFTVDNPVPSIASLSPSSSIAGAGPASVSISGANFLASSTVTIDGLLRASTFVNDTLLTTNLTAPEQATAHVLSVAVVNPGPGGGNSAPASFTVGNPAPAISSITPSGVLVGSNAQVLTINGSGFVPTSVALVAGTTRSTTVVSSTQLTVGLALADQASAGTLPIIVVNPAPGGGSSNVVKIPVNNPVPILSTLAPSSLAVGSGAQSIAVTGSGFVAGAVVLFNSSARSTTYASPTQLTLALTSADLVNAGNYPVAIRNPGPGGGGSNLLTFRVTQSTGASLSLTITGLVAATPANVLVTGPNGFRQLVTATTTLPNLQPGTYALNPSISFAGTPANAAYYWPVSGGGSVVVSVGPAATAVVAYQALTGVWHPLGPNAISRSFASPASGEMRAFSIYNANPSIIYAAGGGPGWLGPYTEAGAFKTTDAGATWTPIDTGITDPSVQVIHVEQANPDNVLCGTYAGGIFRSADGGATWRNVAALGTVVDMLDFGGDIYAGTSQGVAVSSDGGATWTIVAPTNGPVGRLASSGTAIYAGVGFAYATTADDGKVLMRPAPGSAWTVTTPPAPPGSRVYGIAVDPANSQNAYVADEPAGGRTLYVTSDGGATWGSELVPDTVCAAGLEHVAIAASSGLLFAACDGDLNVSYSRGIGWTQVAGEVWDTGHIATDAAGIAGNLVVGSDQGMYQLMANSSTWKSLTPSVNAALPTDVAVNGSTLIVPAQDFIGALVSFDGGNSWAQSTPAGEFGMAVFNPGNPNYVYYLSSGGLQISTNGGQYFGAALPYSVPAWTNQLIAVDPQTPANVYFATSAGTLKSQDYGNTWSMISWPLANSPGPIAVDPSNSSNLYAAGYYGVGRLYVSKDQGASWSTSSVSACAIDSIAIDPGNPAVVAVGTTCHEVEVSTDGGLSFAKNNVVPPGNVSCQGYAIGKAQFDPNGTGLLALATSSGLYLSADRGITLTNIRGNAIPLAFNSMLWTGAALYGATCGEGVLQLQH